MTKSKKTGKIIKIIVLSFLGILAAFIIICAIVLYGRIATIASVSHVGKSLYKVNYQQQYDLDKALDSEIDSVDKLLEFIEDEFFFGYDFNGNVDKYSCSAFLTQTEDEKYLAGRNFDHPDTDTLVVYTHPDDGYASFSSTALDMLGVGSYNHTEALSLKGRVAMLAAPYVCMDGMNEKGLNVSILNLDKQEVHQDSGKPDLLILIAVRLLLDRAANVDEAVDLLSQYDLQMAEGTTQHLFISDKSGKSVVAEWTDDKMKIVESPVCTNFELAPEEGNYKGKCDRFDAITEWLESTPQNNAEDAMEILDIVSITPENIGADVWTEWSCVYNLNDFTVDYALKLGYKSVFSLSKDDF